MEALGVQCVACSVRRKHKSLRYHPETFEAFCENPYVCTEAHPNSPVNIISRKAQVGLLKFDEAQRLYATSTVVDKSDRLRRLLNQPLTVRITSVDMAQFLINYSDELGKSISEVVRELILDIMDRSQKVTSRIVNKPTLDIENNDDDDELVF